MSPTELDRLYGTLAEALGRVGERRAPLLLATLALDLLAGSDDPSVARSAIDRAERLCEEGPRPVGPQLLTARPCGP